ncbi:hypothetical protein [Paenibacillus radicis (ex Gao et al. 2016)]|uniref:Uncharacterized protein n=1 Tax=Paenibacillus radicis (ex Gao et al. 2016) TaxID=1737354 RepID=A0A917HAG4_9BACL|nr:hypothetical protein [Paenibacillus radicis (ex Gao et al. 2016)]GGG71701.1 hypothetical protein GCM10010918_29150 [Paenibacillus radicis (ex Gao et al. 2016)]
MIDTVLPSARTQRDALAAKLSNIAVDCQGSPGYPSRQRGIRVISSTKQGCFEFDFKTALV